MIIKCKVCGKGYRDLLAHLCKKNKKRRYSIFNDPSLFLHRDDIKPDHLERFLRIKKDVLKRDKNIKTRKCFCGGDIYAYHYAVVKEKSVSVETFCQRCGFLWDMYGYDRDKHGGEK